MKTKDLFVLTELMKMKNFDIVLRYLRNSHSMGELSSVIAELRDHNYDIAQAYFTDDQVREFFTIHEMPLPGEG